MATPANLRYSKDHTWVLVSGNTATLGITELAQKQLGEVILVELPKNGNKFEKFESFGTVESVKAVIELFTPVGGEVTATNEKLEQDPILVNDDPYGEGWIIKVKMTSTDDTKELLTAAEYDAFCKTEE
jgi:glycine cleavage system H protein